MIKLGQVVTDSISGFKGVAIARAVYLNGCTRIGIQPKGFKDGKKYEVEWFSELQLKENDGKKPPIHPILGKIAKDKLTGFTGIVPAYTDYLHQEPRIDVLPQKLNKEGRPVDALAFDLSQLEWEKPAEHKEKKQTGGPGPKAPSLKTPPRV